MRVFRDVVVQLDKTSGELSILSEAPGVEGEEMTLAVASAGGEMELRVRVAGSQPQILSGVLRHRVTLQLVSTISSRSDAESSTPR
jgi:hypothetical protein